MVIHSDSRIAPALTTTSEAIRLTEVDLSTEVNLFSHASYSAKSSSSDKDDISPQDGSYENYFN